MRATGYYNVAPRYTGGSPAMVSGDIAQRVAVEERDAYERTLEGWYGPDARATAETRGLRRIAEVVTERAGCWIVEDLITGEHYIRPFEVWHETPLRQSTRFHRLRSKYHLPLEGDLK